MIVAGRRVVLGVSGGIACYKACVVARRLSEAGATVDVIMTAAATEFVRPLTFEALTGRPVLTSLWERDRALAHVHLAAEAELVVVAPATAHLLARAAQGLADDLLTSVLLATEAHVLAAPAMNDRMFAHPATQANLARLAERGWTLVGPGVGGLAEGPSDRPGRMVEPEELLAQAERMLRGRDSGLSGKRILVTAGATREQLDPVRVLTNASTGRMGYAMAEAAFARGAEVILLAGPSTLAPPVGVACRRVETTAELGRAVAELLPSQDVLVMAAAPADFRTEASTVKRPRDGGAFEVTLTPTEDILAATAAHRRPGAIVVGFALETGNGLVRAREKLERKGLHLVVLNHADDPQAGFEVPTNRVTLISADRDVELEVMPKRMVAERIFDEVERLL